MYRREDRTAKHSVSMIPADGLVLETSDRFVIFIIRTRGNPFKSRAHPILVATSLTVATIGAVLPFTSLGTYFGFVPPLGHRTFNSCFRELHSWNKA